MKNESDIEFTASPTLPQGVDFKSDTSQGSRSVGDRAGGAYVLGARRLSTLAWTVYRGEHE